MLGGTGGQALLQVLGSRSWVRIKTSDAQWAGGERTPCPQGSRLRGVAATATSLSLSWPQIPGPPPRLGGPRSVHTSSREWRRWSPSLWGALQGVHTEARLSRHSAARAPVAAGEVLHPEQQRHAGLCPWDCPGKNTGVGCHFLLQGIFLSQGQNSHLHVLSPALQVDSLPLSHQIGQDYRVDILPVKSGNWLV